MFIFVGSLLGIVNIVESEALDILGLGRIMQHDTRIRFIDLHNPSRKINLCSQIKQNYYYNKNKGERKNLYDGYDRVKEPIDKSRRR